MKDKRYFIRIRFTPEQIQKYYKNAQRSLKIASENKDPEVKFDYSYKAFIKAGIAVIAAIKKVRVRGIPGHHMKIIEMMSEILQDDTISAVGNAMRSKRNIDLYAGGVEISKKESIDYYNFVEGLIRKIGKLLKRKQKSEVGRNNG